MRAKSGAPMHPGIERDLGEVDKMFVVFHGRKSKEEVKEDSFVRTDLTFNCKGIRLRLRSVVMRYRLFEYRFLCDIGYSNIDYLVGSYLVIGYSSIDHPAKWVVPIETLRQGPC